MEGGPSRVRSGRWGVLGLRPEFLSSRRLHALVLFASCFCAAAYSVLHNVQLRGLEGMADEWVNLGFNLAVYGTLGIGPEPITLRPPGYPFFVAVVLRTLTGSPAELAWDWEHAVRGFVAVYLVQCVVLALTTACLYLWLSGFLRKRVAFLCAFAFGLNPYCIILTGLLHYDVLHVFGLVAGCWALDRALGDKAAPPRAFLIAGLIWGVVTLVRPTTLLLPFFVLAALLLRRSTRAMASLRPALLFTAGLGLTLAPWTARNYAVTGRLIPVNEQASAVLWGSTVKKLGVHPNHYRWASLSPEIVRVFNRVTGEREYSYLTYVRHNSAHEAAFRAELLQNLRRAPGVYLDNVASNLVAFTLHINSVWLKAYQYLQTPRARLRPSWFEVGNPQDFHPSTVSRIFAAYMYLVTAMAAAGLWSAWRRRDPHALAPGVVFLCLGLSHALTLMDLMYFYQRVPFLYVFAGFLVDASHDRSLRIPSLGLTVPLGRAVAEPLLLSVVALTVWIL